MKKLILITIALLVLLAKAFPQKSIYGIVKSEKGEELVGANIYIENTYDGASSGLQGTFQFMTAEEGQKVLVVSSIGYHTLKKPININSISDSLNIFLREKIDQLNAVTITAGAMEASDMKKAVVMKPLDIVTTSGALGDIIGAFTKLPGTATVGNDGRLFVRGGDASETNIYFDGLQVGNAFGSTAQNVPTRSRFNPNLFQGSFFSTGGYSAEYGQALSSALVLNSIDMPVRNQTDISLMSVGGGLTQTLVGKTASVTGSVNLMELSPYMSIINQNMDFTDAPSNWNAELLGRKKIGEHGLLKAFIHSESANVSLNRYDVNIDKSLQTKVENVYHHGNINFKNIINSQWSYYGGAAYSFNHDRFTLDNTKLEKTNQLYHLKGVLVHDVSDRFSYKNGFETYGTLYQEQVVTEQLGRNFEENLFNHFFEADYYFSKKLVFRGGLRTTYSRLLKRTWINPRMSLAYKASSHGQFSLAYGEFNQLPINEMRVQNNMLGNIKATHYIANYFYHHKGRTVRGELFHKSYRKLVQFESFDGFDYLGLSNRGNGFAHGIDFFYRDNRSLKETDFWVTYSFINSKRNLGSFEGRVQPGFAPRHNASVVMKRFVQALHSQLGFSYSWNSGYSYHNPNEPGEMQSVTKPFNNLSVSWSYLPRPNLIIHFECSNVLGADNIFGYQFSNTADIQGNFVANPIGQVADRFLFLGVFLTLSKDKNANQLNNL